ncbi:MAG: hypothetical protein R3F16_01775 [Myxococcota bacterium]
MDRGVAPLAVSRTVLVLMVSIFLVSGGRARAQVGATSLQACVQAEALFFSTESGFLSLGPIPPDGSPLVSEGDLLGRSVLGCHICARNADLLAAFSISEDLGLDAVDVVADATTRVVVFSTEVDGPSLGTDVRAGDLLASNGAIIPNEVLLDAFSPTGDMGLDAVHGVGEPSDLLAFWADAAGLTRTEWTQQPGQLVDLLVLHDVDLWISTEVAAGPVTGPLWLAGDLLSVRSGLVLQRQHELLPEAVPAGLPVGGVDFGLDAVTADRSGQISTLAFSVERGSVEPIAFGESDVLGLQLGWKGRGEGLARCFEPKFLPLGLDALAIATPEPALGPGIAAALGALAFLGRRRPQSR